MSAIQTPLGSIRYRPSIRDIEPITRAAARALILVVLAVFLILVLLPAALGAVAPPAIGAV